MNKNVIINRKNSICRSIDDFFSSDVVMRQNQEDKNYYQNIIVHFQKIIKEEKNNWHQFVIKEIENHKEDLIQRKEYIKAFRREKANILNQLIIKNRRLKRNIQKYINRKNEICNKNIDIMCENSNSSRNNFSILSKQIERMKASKNNLLQIYKQSNNLKEKSLNNVQNEIYNMKKHTKNAFYQIQYDIYEYANNIINEKKKEDLKKFKETQNYYLTEISKLQQFNKGIIASLNSLCNEFNIFPIESSSKEIKNKSLSVGEDAIFAELSKIVPIRKRMEVKPSAKIIVSYIVKSLKEKDKSIINDLRQKEDSCAILKYKIKTAEIKKQFNQPKNGGFIISEETALNFNHFDLEQSEIEKNIHDIKLMQRSLFE